MRLPRWLAVLLPLAAGLAAAWPVLRGGFSNDDDLLIVNNPYVHDLAHLGENLTRDYFYSVEARPIGYYRPLTKLGYVVQYQAFGAQPLGYHATSVALHLLGVLAVYALIRRLHRDAPAWLAALLYAAHPAQAESVAIVTSQSDLLVTAALCGALALYVQFRQEGRRVHLAGALALEAVALASKETGVLVLPLALLWEAAQAGFAPRALARARALLWLALPVAAYAALRIGLGVLPVAVPLPASGLEVAADAAKLLGSALLRAVVPTLWAPYLHATHARGGEALLWGAPVLAATGLAVVAFVRWPRWRWLGPLLLLPLLPVVDGERVRGSIDPRLLVVADRWVLLPAVGAALLWACVLEQLRQRLATPRSPAIAAALGLALAVALGLEAREENASHRDEARRMEFVGRQLAGRRELTPAEQDQVLAARALGAERRGDRQAALGAYIRLAEAVPNDYSRRSNLAAALYADGQVEAALFHALTAFHGDSPNGTIRLVVNDSFRRNRPDRAYLVGLLLEQLGQPAAAVPYYEFCLRANPSHDRARQALARVKP